MPLEPRIKALVALGNRSNPGNNRPMAIQRMADLRAGSLSRIVVLKGARVQSITHHMVPVEGGQILVRIYRPHHGTLPLHVFFHGGGFCTGNLMQRDDRCKDLAVDAGCVVASVGYRLAPENRYPTAPEDCYAALCWLTDHADEVGIDAGTVSVGGESAGANLAAVVALMARDRHGPRLVFQLLDVPATDLTLSQPSIRELGNGYMLTLDGMEDFMRNYIDPDRVTEPYASPLLAPDLSGLPPAWIMSCEFDPLRNDGEGYAKRLEEAGVAVQFQLLDGHVHPSFAFSRISASARRYLGAAGMALRAAHRSALESVTRAESPA
jgi:acetyl esterase